MTVLSVVSALFQNMAADDCQRTPRQTPMKSTTVTGQPLPVHEVSDELTGHHCVPSVCVD